MTLRVDAHVHVWNTVRQPQPWVDPATMPELARDFTAADDVAALLRETACDRAVLVQTLNQIEETWELLDALALPHVGAVIGWVDLAGDTEADLARLAEHPHAAGLRGVRHLAHLEQDPQWLLRDDVGAGIRAVGERSLLVELVVRKEQLGTVAELVAAHPEVRFVLDHLGKPDVASGEVVRWSSDLGRCGSLPNLVAKLSGLTLEADRAAWTARDLEPYLDAALQAFGADRLMYGSDWPLVRLCGGELAWHRALAAWLHQLSVPEREAILGGSAQACYALD